MRKTLVYKFQRWCSSQSGLNLEPRFIFYFLQYCTRTKVGEEHGKNKKQPVLSHGVNFLRNHVRYKDDPSRSRYLITRGY